MPEGQLKHYEYIVSLEETIIYACIEDELPKARNRGIKPDNPRNIAPNIATVPAPPTSELVARHRTRFTDLTMSLTLVPNVTEEARQEQVTNVPFNLCICCVISNNSKVKQFLKALWFQNCHG